MLNISQITFELHLIENIVLIKKNHPNPKSDQKIEVTKPGQVAKKSFHMKKKSKFNALFRSDQFQDVNSLFSGLNGYRFH